MFCYASYLNTFFCVSNFFYSEIYVVCAWAGIIHTRESKRPRRADNFIFKFSQHYLKYGFFFRGKEKIQIFLTTVKKILPCRFWHFLLVSNVLPSDGDFSFERKESLWQRAPGLRIISIRKNNITLLLSAIVLVWNMSFDRPWNLLYKNWVGPKEIFMARSRKRKEGLG